MRWRDEIQMKKIVVLFLLSICVLSTLSCSKKIESVFSSSIKIGTSVFPPFSYMSGDECIGFDAELAKIIAKDLGKELELVVMEFEALIPALENGKIDMIVSSMTVTDERKDKLDFSISYYTTSQVAIVRKENLETFSDIRSRENLGEGRSIAAEANSVGASVAKNITTSEPVVEGLFHDLLLEIIAGNIDVGIFDKAMVNIALSQYSELEALPIKFEEEHYAIAVPKGHTKLLESINASINQLVTSGIYNTMVETYYNINSYNK